MNVITTKLITEAIFSDDGSKRYLLRKTWDEKKKKLAVIMLSASTVSGVECDYSSMLVLNNASRLDFGSVDILNISASLDDHTLSEAEVDDSKNLDVIAKSAENADVIVYAAGVGKSKSKVFQDLQKNVMEKLRPHEAKLNCLCNSSGTLDESVVNLISNIVFDDSKIESIVSAYKEYYNSQDDTYRAEISRLEKLVKETDKKIYNLVSAIAKVGISEALEESLKSAEEEKANINYQLSNVKLMAEKSTLTDETIIKAFNSVKAEFRKGTLNGVKEIIDRFVDKVIVYADRVEVVLYYGSDLLKLISSEYANAPTLVWFPIKDFLINFEDKKRKHNFFQNCVFLGGEGEIRTLAPLSRPTPLAGAPLRPA